MKHDTTMACGVPEKRRIPHPKKWKWVRLARFAVHNCSLPGNRNVPFYDVVSYLMRGIGDGQLWRASKGLAFSFLMAMPPLLIFVFSLIAFLPVAGFQDELLFQLSDLIPDRLFEPIAKTVNDVMGHKHTSLLSLGFIFSIILAANAVHGMMMYFSDRSHEVRPFFIRYLICIGIVFVLYFAVIVMLALLLGYKTALIWLFQQGILIPGSLTHISIAVGRWIIIIAVGLFTLTFIYYLIPLKKSRVGFFSPGAVFALGLFLVLSWGFRIYLVHFDKYNLLYGSIGTLLLVMLWLLLNCMVLMMGYELNVAIVNGILGGKNSRSHRLAVFRRKYLREKAAQRQGRHQSNINSEYPQN